MSKVSKLAFLSVAVLLGFAQHVSAGSHKSCSTTPQSCSSGSSSADSCCVNTPGGLLVQTQFWDYNPATGPSNSWTVHGLWPDYCNGTYGQYCDTNREYTNITQIIQSFGDTSLLSYMQTYWKDYQGNDETFWEHEFGKHATCISTLSPSCYDNYTPQQEVIDFFTTAVNLYKGLDSYQFLSAAGIVPSSTKTYALSAVQAALSNAFGYVPTIQCDNNNAINEIWYYHDTQGPSTPDGKFVPTDNKGIAGDCPSTVKYIPKGGSSSPTTSSPTSNPTGGSISGKGYVDVKQSGSTNGCLISAGTWYTTGTCATYTASASGSGFTLSTSKGSCAISSSSKALTCGSSVSSPTVFGSSGSLLTYGGSTSFSASAVASGSTQQTVYSGSGSVALTLSWRSA